MQVPTLDFSHFSNGNEAQKLAVSIALVESFSNHGFVKVINHGVSETSIGELATLNKSFFDLAHSSKNKVVNKPSPRPQRGWSYMGAETTSHLREHKGAPEGTLTDEKEHFDAGPSDDTLFPNRWPSEDLPHFQGSMEKIYGICQQFCLQIMEACEIGMHLPPGTLIRRCVPATSELRLNYYPAVSIQRLQEGRTKRGWPHTDFGIITLLFQDAVGGLEIENRSQPDTFEPLIRDSPSEIAINVSDTFQRWTNGTLRAGVHQVTVPSTMKVKPEAMVPQRRSAVFFFKAHRDVSVGPLAEFVSPNRPAKYEEMTALQFHQQMTGVLIQTAS